MPFLRTSLVLLSALASAQIVTAQSPSPEAQRLSNPPRTSDGHPDLQGYWTTTSATRLERPRGLDKLVLSADEAKAFEDGFIWNIVAREQEAEGPIIDNTSLPPSGAEANLGTRGYEAYWLETGEHIGQVKGEFRSSWITEPANGQLPRKGGGGGGGFGGGSTDGPEARSSSERCLANIQGGPVLQNFFYNNNHQIVQTPGHVMIFTEMMSETRIIPIVDGPDSVEHLPDVITPWFGDSVGWYEGDKLVIETVNANPEQGSLLSPNGKMIERFSLWSEDQILYEFEVDDPDLYTQTWKGEMSLNRFDDGIYEFACHEANYSLPGTLQAARFDERNASSKE